MPHCARLKLLLNENSTVEANVVSDGQNDRQARAGLRDETLLITKKIEIYRAMLRGLDPTSQADIKHYNEVRARLNAAKARLQDLIFSSIESARNTSGAATDSTSVQA